MSNDLAPLMDSILDTIQGLETRLTAKFTADLRAVESRYAERVKAAEASVSGLQLQLTTVRAELDATKVAQFEGLRPVLAEWVTSIKSMQPRDGVDGRPGKDGADGANGADGLNGKDGVPGRDGASVDLAAVKAMVSEEVARAALALPVPAPGRDGKDGTSIDPAVIDVMVSAQVERAVKALPPARDGSDGLNGKDGASVTVADVLPTITAEVASAVARIPAPKDGRDGLNGKDAEPLDMARVEASIASRVELAVKALPLPSNGRDGQDGKDGSSVAVADIEPVLSALVTKAVSALPVAKDGRDGVGVTNALVTRSGNIALTFSDGQTKDAGSVVPDRETVTRIVSDLVAAFPKPKDGEPGPAGRDGTLEQLKAEFDGKRTLTLCRKDGTPVEGGVVVLPIPSDEGVWKPGILYAKGEGVTWGGSFWIAQEATRAKPDHAGPDSRAWRLAVKRGTDGKDGRDGKDAD